MVVHGTLALVVAFTLTSVSTVVVALRFYSRYFLVGKLASPDWAMLVALIVTWGTPIINYYQLQYMDYSHVHDAESFKRVASGSLLFMYLFRLNYILAHLLIKTSILLFYATATAAHRTYHLPTLFLLVLNLLASLAMALVSILICNPPQDAWDGAIFLAEFRGIWPAQCLNPATLWITQAAYNLATDSVIMVLPIPFFLNLRSMPVRRRVELAAIFSIGLVAVSASAVRLATTMRWLSSFEESGRQWANLLVWSQVEQHSGIVAASIPFLRPMFTRIVRRVRGVRETPSSPVPKLMAGLGSRTPPWQWQGERVRFVMPRTPIIPSPAPTGGSEEGFRRPPTVLEPIRPEGGGFQGGGG